MKSTIFVLMFQLYGDPSYVRPLGVYADLEQCRASLATHESDNKAAAYLCAPADVAGNWSRKNARYLAKD
jgi:hypothetical protein